jgi:outer membrane cobalamin receptor
MASFSQSFFVISAATSWKAPALQLYIDSSADCEPEKIRTLDAGVGRPSSSIAMNEDPTAN